MSTPQEMGRLWEEEWKRTIAGTLTVSSGNKFFDKLDVRGKKITWSNKWTGSASISLTKPLIDEFVRATSGPGSTGSVRMGALALRMPHNDLVVMRAEDFLELMKGEAIIEPSKGDVRRATANVPQLLRETA